MTGDVSDRDGEPADPRLSGDHVRSVDGVTLVGTVHDHPASAYRARTVVDRRSPAVLALELPPLAVPHFERQAAGAAVASSESSAGGEMSAAIRAATTDRVVGIDGPSIGFLRTLASHVVREQPATDTLADVLAGLRSAGGEALRCRAAGALATHTAIRLDPREPVAHDCRPADDPAVQAADERRQIGRARAVTNAFEPSRAARFRDATREAHMARRVDALRRHGDVVAVVGYGHLDALEARLRDRVD